MLTPLTSIFSVGLAIVCDYCILTIQDSNPNVYSARLYQGSNQHIIDDTRTNNFKTGVLSSHAIINTFKTPTNGNNEYESAEYVYDYIPQASNDDDYDYESPYWVPADQKTELLSQFRKLRIPSVALKEIE